MYVNAYEFTLTTSKGDTIDVALRLNVMSQIALKKKWKEDTNTTLFNSTTDIERFVDVMEQALKWAGNTNKIKSGIELVDLMAENDMLGVAAKQHIIATLGRVSGIFSSEEKEELDKRIDKQFADDGEDAESKN